MMKLVANKELKVMLSVAFSLSDTETSPANPIISSKINNNNSNKKHVIIMGPSEIDFLVKNKIQSPLKSHPVLNVASGQE